MTKEFPFLINKIDEFIRKYYKNQLLKGGLFTLGALTAFFIAVNLLEYFGNQIKKSKLRSLGGNNQ